MLYVTITRNLNVFNALTLKKNFWKNQTVFKKLEYSFLVESTKIKNITSTYKTALSEANLKTNRKKCIPAVQKGPIKKRGVLPVKKSRRFFNLRTSNKELIWWTHHPNVHTHTFRKRWNFISECIFPVSILNLDQLENITTTIQLDYQ